MPTAVVLDFHVRATAQTHCPICGTCISVVHRKDEDEVHWHGSGCAHLRPFDFHRHVTRILDDEGRVVEVIGGPLYAKFTADPPK